MDAQDASHDKVEEQNFEVVNHDNDSIEAQKDNGIIVDSLGRTTKRREDTSSDRVTIKTWIIISILSLIYGLAWWPIPVTIILQSYIAADFEDPQSAYWYVSVFAAMVAVGFLVAGPNSDLYGRRMTLILGEAGLGVGLIISAASKTPSQFQAGMGISGFFAGVCYMILCSIPELLPLKHRHIGLGIADGTGFVTVVIGPIAARMAGIDGGQTWRWLYWADVILIFVTLVLVVWLYHPPKHPKGVPWHEALIGFDWIGVLLSSAGLILLLTGIVYTSYVPSNDLRVILPLTFGFGALLVFAFWEAYSNVKFKLCPPAMFKQNSGRDFTMPLIAESIIFMYYYGMNIIYPTMVTELWVHADTSISAQLALTTPSNLGLCAGIIILTCFGSLFSRWIGFKKALIIGTGLMLISGGILTLVTPYNETLMIVFTVFQQMWYAYSAIAAITLVLWGVHQHDLGIATGLAGVGRGVGGSLSQAIYTTILVNTQARSAAHLLPKAVIDAGLSASGAQQLLEVWALGPASRLAVPGVNADILSAASLAWKWSYCRGLRMVGLASLGFGFTAFFLLFFCIDPEPRMTDRIEVFLENDVQADKNEFH